MRPHGLTEWVLIILLGCLIRADPRPPSDHCASFATSNCSCYLFAEGIFVECRGTPPRLTIPVNSLTIHELERTQITAAMLPVEGPLRQLQVSHSALTDIHDHAFDNVKNHLESLILVFGKLKRVPQKSLNGLLALRSLDLEGNEITEIPNYNFYGLKLFKLTLKANLLERVSEYAFSGLEKTLTELDLGENRLKAFPMKSLRLLENLMSVRLGWNEIDSIHDDGFSRVSFLRVLDLSSNNFQHIPANCFRPMSSLTTLTMYSNTIETVHIDAFITLHSLEYLDLSHNKVIHLDSGVFRYNKNLRTLDLTHNHIHVISGLFENLPNLYEVFISENNILDVPSDAFINSFDISTLRLQDNGIRRIEPRAFDSLKNVTELYFTRNFIEALDDDVFSAVISLTNLHLDYNQVSQISLKAFSNLKHLRELRLDNNRLKSISNGLFDGLLSLTELHLQNNVLKTIEPGTFKLLKNLQHINLQGNSINQLGDVFSHSKNLLSVQLDSNRVENINNTQTQKHTSLQIIWLGHNRLKSLDQKMFSSLHLIQRIYFTNNTISVIEDRALSSMQALVFLDLTRNLLQSISKYTFNNLSHLEELHLSRNRIQSIVPFAFSSLRKLRNLDLSYNKLIHLGENIFQTGLPIRFLSLKCSGVRNIHEKSFHGLNNLNELNLDENELAPAALDKLNIPGLRILKISGNGFNSLNTTLQKLESVQVVTFVNSSINFIPETMFLNNKALSSLSLSINSLTSLAKTTLKEQKNLSELKLSSNLFRQIPSEALESLQSLTLLDFSNNLIETLDLSLLKDLTNIRELDFRNNVIDSISGSSENLTQIQVVHLHGNRISNIPDSFFISYPQLRKLDVSDNKLTQFPLSAVTSSDLNWLNVSSNPLQRIKDPRTHRKLPHIEELHITATNLTVLTSTDLEVFPTLLHLYLFRNKIVRISPSAFASLIALLTLDISSNELETLPPERLQGMRELQILNISHNKLKDVEPFTADLRRLQVRGEDKIR